MARVTLWIPQHCNTRHKERCFSSLMGRPWPAPRTQDFTLPMPASQETTEAFYLLPPPALCSGMCSPAWVISARNWPAVPHEYIQSSFHCNKDCTVQPCTAPSPFLLSLPLSFLRTSSQGILPFFLSWMQGQVPSGSHSPFASSKTAWALKSFCK